MKTTTPVHEVCPWSLSLPLTLPSVSLSPPWGKKVKQRGWLTVRHSCKFKPRVTVRKPRAVHARWQWTEFIHRTHHNVSDGDKNT